MDQKIFKLDDLNSSGLYMQKMHGFDRNKGKSSVVHDLIKKSQPNQLHSLNSKVSQ